MMFPSFTPRAAALAAIGLLAAVPAAADPQLAATQAPEGRRAETVGSTRHEWTGSGQCRGAKLRAIRDTMITGFDISLRDSVGKRVRFHIYEAFYDDESYALVRFAGGTKTGTVGNTFDWEASPDMQVPLVAQKYYALVACWDPDDETSYRGAPKVAPQDLSFGEYLGGTYFDNGGRPPDELRWTTSTHDYYLRVRTAPTSHRADAIPFHDTDPFLHDPERGRPGANATPSSHDGSVTPSAPSPYGTQPASCSIVRKACDDL